MIEGSYFPGGCLMTVFRHESILPGRPSDFQVTLFNKSDHLVQSDFIRRASMVHEDKIMIFKK